MMMMPKNPRAPLSRFLAGRCATRGRIPAAALACSTLALLASSPAYGTESSLRFEAPAQDAPTPAGGTAASSSAPEAASPASSPPAAAGGGNTLFLDPGWHGLSIGGGVAFASDSTDSNAVVTYHHFLAQDFEFNLSLGGWFYAQDDEDEDGGGDENEPGEDALGINPAFGFRWHFWNSVTPQAPADRSWSVYADIGIGMVFTDEEVPPGGTTYNFTPRAGVGATFALGQEGTRLDLGLRWAHVSNASTSGTDDNPSRDSAMVYVGVMFPF